MRLKISTLVVYQIVRGLALLFALLSLLVAVVQPQGGLVYPFIYSGLVYMILSLCEFRFLRIFGLGHLHTGDLI